MKKTSLALLTFGLVIGLRADVTARFHNAVQFGPQFPAAVQAQLAAQSAMVAQESVLTIKGNEAEQNSGPLISIVDVTTDEVTLLDPRSNTYTTLKLSDFGSEMAKAGLLAAGSANHQAMQQAMAAMTANVESHATGKTDTIAGIAVSETDLTMTLEIDPSKIPGAGATAAGVPAIPMMRMEFHVWQPTQDTIQQHPELVEWNKMQGALATINPMRQMLQGMLGQLPGGDKLSDAFAKLQSNTAPVLRTDMQLYMPMLAMIAQAAAARGATLPPGSDYSSDQPAIEVTSELSSLTNAPVDAAKFEVPGTYKAAALPDFFKALQASQAPGKTQYPHL